jgi:hypothetical protein
VIPDFTDSRCDLERTFVFDVSRSQDQNFPWGLEPLELLEQLEPGKLS